MILFPFHHIQIPVLVYFFFFQTFFAKMIIFLEIALHASNPSSHHFAKIQKAPFLQISDDSTLPLPLLGSDIEHIHPLHGRTLCHAIFELALPEQSVFRSFAFGSSLSCSVFGLSSLEFTKFCGLYRGTWRLKGFALSMKYSPNLPFLRIKTGWSRLDRFGFISLDPKFGN